MNSFPTNASDRVLIAANPRAGARWGGKVIDSVAEALDNLGLAVSVMDDLDRITRTASQWHSAGQLRALVAAGGDGTVAELVNRTEPGVPIAVLPLGTANLLAKYLGISANPQVFSRMVADGATCSLDAGRANQRIFLLMVGVGFDADVVRRLHDDRRGHINYFSYAKPILSAVRSYQYPTLRVYCEAAGGGVPRTITGRWAFVANLPCYAAGLQFAADADGGDGLLDVCTFSGGSLWDGLRYLSYVLLGKHQELHDCCMATGSRLRIEADGPVPYQLDGDPGGMLPLEIEILPRRLSLVLPKTSPLAQAPPLRLRAVNS